jgi:hypothetical protein
VDFIFFIFVDVVRVLRIKQPFSLELFFALPKTLLK